MTAIEMQTRACVCGCLKTFRVLATSKQLYQSRHCEYTHLGPEAMKCKPKVLKTEEVTMDVTPLEPTGRPKRFTVLSPFEKKLEDQKKALKEEERVRVSVTEKELPKVEAKLKEPDPKPSVTPIPIMKNPEPKPITKPTKKRATQNAAPGPKKIVNVSSQAKESTMQKTEKKNFEKSLSAATKTTPLSDSSALSVHTELVPSQSMSLLSDVSEHLFSLMKGLHANQPEPEIRSYDPERVNASCNAAKNIREIMKLKLEAIKVQAQLQGRL